MSEATRILDALEQGDAQSAEQLLPLVYEELRQLAARKIAEEKPGQTLDATALVHEAYVRLVDDEKSRQWNSRGHFFAAAAEAMRRILIENARRKKRAKHGGEWQRIMLDQLAPLADASREDLLAVDEALSRLEATDADAAVVVKLRFYAGLTMAEIAQSLDISLRSAERNWTFARTWLHRELACADDDSAFSFNG